MKRLNDPSAGGSALFLLYGARNRLTDEKVSVFVSTFDWDGTGPFDAKGQWTRDGAVFNAMQRLKTLRHPGIVKYKDSFVSAKRLHVVTEPVVPLWNMIGSLAAEEIGMGLYNILVGALFSLEKEANADQTWLLGRLEYLSPSTQVTQDVVQSITEATPAAYVPPEDLVNDKDSPDPNARDVFQLGVLINQCINSTAQSAGGPYLNWSTLENLVGGLKSPSSAERPSVTKILQNRFFSESPLIFAVEVFLKNVRVFGKEQKEAGFRTLAEIMAKVPFNAVCPYIASMVLSREILSEPGSHQVFRFLFSERNFGTESKSMEFHDYYVEIYASSLALHRPDSLTGVVTE
ncbi:Protein-associating with the carboxyl-terminal domain of ezrin, partial [Cladochytrium tenue]